MTTSETSKNPTHRVSAVFKKPGDEKGFWVNIGGLWPHRDGKGYSMKLDLVPRGDAELVIRLIEDKPADQPADAAEGGAA